VQEWSEYYEVDSETNVVYNINPETYKIDISTVVTGENR
jgi:hypothetical protein